MRLQTTHCFFGICFVVAFIVNVSLTPAEEISKPADQQFPELKKKSEQPQDPLVELNKEYFKGYWTDTKAMITAPMGWDQSDWIKASVVLGVSVGLFTQDDKIKIWVQKHKTGTTIHLADDASKVYTYALPALAGLGLYGYVVNNEKAKTTFLLGAESAIITTAFVQTLKRSTGRHRPSTGDSHDTWSGPTFTGHNERLSFPSGDASTAFALASVVASEYDNYVVPPAVYTAATLVALERVHNNAHWSSDVFIGSAIGYFTGKAVVHYHSGRQESILSFSPLIDGKDVGIMMNCRY
jgi:hypothetical protein